MLGGKKKKIDIIWKFHSCDIRAKAQIPLPLKKNRECFGQTKRVATARVLAHSYCGPHFVRLSVTTGFHEARAGSKNAMGQEESVAPGRGYGAVLSELPSEGLLRDDLTWGEGVPALSRSTCQSQGLHLSGPHVFVPRVLRPGPIEG